ncbi:MAG: DUF2804 family protein [Tenericutes bacterium]|nr:DUF2804 family protein [Mycoplasmatota bacterium]
MNIPKTRDVLDTPDKLVNDCGDANFGAFNRSFCNFNFSNFKSCSKIRSWLNKQRLTEWEAVEVVSDLGAFLTVVYHFGIMNIHKTIFFNKKTEELLVWDDLVLFRNKSIVAKNLMDSNQSIFDTKHSKTVITNNYEKNAAACSGHSKDKKNGEIDFDFQLTRISKPSIVSIPLKNTYPVYTEKDLFTFKGSIKVNGVEMFDDKSIAIIDDHRGFYPRKSGYDWLTFFGYHNEEPFGLNLTDFLLNERQEDFNENGYWDKLGFHALPNATFTCSKTKKHIVDESGTIDLTYEIIKTHKVSMNILLFRIDYKLNFGKLNGFITNTAGEKIIFKDELSLAEYRYTIL